MHGMCCLRWFCHLGMYDVLRYTLDGAVTARLGFEPRACGAALPLQALSSFAARQVCAELRLHTAAIVHC